MFVPQSAKNAKITAIMEIVLSVNNPAKKLSLENVFQLLKIALLPSMFLMESASTLTLHVEFSKRQVENVSAVLLDLSLMKKINALKSFALKDLSLTNGDSVSESVNFVLNLTLKDSVQSVFRDTQLQEEFANKWKAQ